MAGLTRETALKWLLVVLCLVPVLLFAYLGQFSRIIADDFNLMTVGRELGPWGSMHYWRNTFNGSYSHYYLHGLVAPFDTLVPRIMPTIIIAIWIIGLAWFLSQALQTLQVNRNRRLIAIAVAALIVAAAINTFYSTQSLLWYAASTRYALPLAALSIYLAALLKGVLHLRGVRDLTLAAVASAVASFVIAGFSEMHMVFQLVLFTLVLVFAFVLMDKTRRHGTVVLLGAGWVATLVSLAVQWTAPGVALRMEASIAEWASPVRSLPELIGGTLGWTFQLIGHQAGFAGFMMLLAVGFFLTVTLYKTSTADSKPPPFNVASAPHLLGLLLQLTFVPLLWSHVSDNPQVLGRYSLPFMLVICINGALSAVFVLLIGQGKRVGSMLGTRDGGLRVYVSVLLLGALLVFGLTQLRSIDHKAATYLFTTAVLLVGICCWQVGSAYPNPAIRRLWLYALLWFVSTVIIIAAIVCVALYGQGTVVARLLAAPAFMQVVGGLIWGVLLGLSVMRVAAVSETGRTWIRGLKWASAAVVLIILIGIAIGLRVPIDDMSKFAEEWDNRHLLMLRLRDSGANDVEVPLLEFDVNKYLCCSNVTSRDKANYYYGIESRDLGRDAE